MFANLKFGRKFTGRSLSRSSGPRGLQFEALERRDVMAGNVLASMAGGDLVITGDGAANGVVVTRIGAGAYEVRGSVAGGGETRINGQLGVPAKVTGVTDDVLANLYGGNDEITFFGSVAAPFVVPDGLFVNMDAGNDKVGMDFVKTGGNLEVNSGSGVDSFIAVGVNVGNNMFVRESTSPFYTGNYDFVNIYGGSRVGNQLNVKLNQGHDTFKTNGTTAKSLWIEGGAGNDTTFVDNTTASAFIRIDPGAGSDGTTVQNSNVGDYLTVTESSGTRSANDQDGVGVSNVTAKNYVNIVGNQGRERVTIDRVTTDRLYASLGAGDDWMNIKFTTLRAWSIDGGSGYDTLYRYGNNKTFGSSNFNSFSSMYL